MRPLPLSQEQRSAGLEELRRTSAEEGSRLDILVIGGGVTGAGIALDAVTRGLSVGVVEAQDWGSGTSSRSSKLVHGGLRYLQMLDFRLVHEALTERDLLLKHIAPHLVRPVPFLFPLKHRIWERAYVGAGVALYDLLASLARGRRALPWHEHSTRTGMERHSPDVRHDAAVGAVRYWDATVDDARLVATLIRSAVSYGAHAVSRAQALRLTKSSSGVVDGAVLADLETDREITVRADQVINATGVWTSETEALVGGEAGLNVKASKGVHITVPRNRIRGDSGLIVPTEQSVLFLIPQARYWIIGTTDTPWELERQHPVATRADINYLLEQANNVLERPLSEDDIIGTWAGLRPLLQPATSDDRATTKISREHSIASPAPGFTVIAGGKLTTYRVMARDAVDFALGARATRMPSITHRVPLVGAQGLEVLRRQARRLAAVHDWSISQVSRLMERYGSMLTELLDLIFEQPDLAEPLEHAPGYLRAEIAYAVSHEGALHLEDVFYLRTRLAHEQPDRGLSALPEIAELVGERLGWDAAAKEREITVYRASCRAEAAALNADTDIEAEQLRLQVQDIAPLLRVGQSAVEVGKAD